MRNKVEEFRSRRIFLHVKGDGQFTDFRNRIWPDKKSPDDDGMLAATWDINIDDEDFKLNAQD
eukprot:CAMPEP_0184483684 /NCGR_PEP_ID=MMETSP0113_2-20130426/5364_1 /TAXON_ID=91329 /ORGANISM="Norrisiella sphaerica, Strain BC52" /LENGTH=62 /DNA_ID=CAMNT_0026864243 /DNA_START=395 /DNA_END=583 /DNA_ORIENTATION=+